MKYLTLACAFLMLCAQSNAQWAPQPTRPKQPAQQNSKSKQASHKKVKEEEPDHMNNTVFVEALGVQIISLNYQRNIYLSKRWDLGVGIGMHPFILQTNPPIYDGKKFTPGAMLLTQGMYKLRKGGAFGFGVGWRCQVIYELDLFNNNEIYTWYRGTGIGEFGYAQEFGKHIYSGIYTYVCYKNWPSQVYGTFGVKLGYSFGKRRADY